MKNNQDNNHMRFIGSLTHNNIIYVSRQGGEEGARERISCVNVCHMCVVLYILYIPNTYRKISFIIIMTFFSFLLAFFFPFVFFLHFCNIKTFNLIAFAHIANKYTYLYFWLFFFLFLF